MINFSVNTLLCSRLKVAKVGALASIASEIVISLPAEAMQLEGLYALKDFISEVF